MSHWPKGLEGVAKNDTIATTIAAILTANIATVAPDADLAEMPANMVVKRSKDDSIASAYVVLKESNGTSY